MLKRLGQRLSFCSRDGRKAAAYQRQYGGDAAYDDLKTALDNPDIESCVICVPHHLHEDYAVAAVRGRRHVLLEKPLAHSMASAERIVELAAGEGRHRTFMIAEQMEYLPVLANMKKLAGASKPVSYVLKDHSGYRPTNWRTRLEGAGGGVMLDLGIHYVSFAVKAFGPIVSHKKDVLQVIPNTEVPSAERLFIRHVNGIEGEVDVAWAQETAVTSIEVRTATSTFTYQPGRRTAMLGRRPQFVCLRGANGRVQMMEEYLSRCRGAQPVHDIAQALPVLAAVLQPPLGSFLA